MRTLYSTAYVFTLGLCLIILLLAAPAVATARQGRQPQPAAAQPQVWWSPPPRGDAERGQLAEIKDKRRVYVAFFAFTSKRHGEDVRRHVLRALASYGGVEVVSSAEQADFALHVRAARLPPRNPRLTGREPSYSDAPLSLSPPGELPWPTTLKLSVLVKGAEQGDGTHRPRLVWEKGQEAWSYVGADAGSGVNALIRDLKKLRGER